MDSNESSNEKAEIQLEIERNPEMDKLAERKISGQSVTMNTLRMILSVYSWSL